MNVVERHQDTNYEDHVYVTYLRVRQPRVIRETYKRPIKHPVDHSLEEKLSKPFYFLQNTKGKVTDVFYPHEDPPDIIGLKKGKIFVVFSVQRSREPQVARVAKALPLTMTMCDYNQ